jgi:S1-C subfamily serine protease
MTTLNDFSNDLSKAVAAASAAVVRVEGRKWMAGSGIAWGEGVVVTANHVVERDENLVVGLPDGSTAAAAIAGRDPSTDLAVLRVEASGLATLPPSDPAAWQVGQIVLAVGRPGEKVQASLGVISALENAWRTPAGARVEYYLQPDLVMYPGFSGGALVDVNGTLLGLNTSGVMRNAALTLPVPTLARVVETLLAHGHMRRAFLGIGSQPVRLPETLAGQLGQETGLLVSSVEPGSPADKGGLMLGDTLVAINGQATRHMDDLLTFLNGDVAGQTAAVKVVRGGAVQVVSVTLGER